MLLPPHSACKHSQHAAPCKLCNPPALCPLKIPTLYLRINPPPNLITWCQVTLYWVVKGADTQATMSIKGTNKMTSHSAYRRQRPLRQPMLGFYHSTRRIRNPYGVYFNFNFKVQGALQRTWQPNSTSLRTSMILSQAVHCKQPSVQGT